MLVSEPTVNTDVVQGKSDGESLFFSKEDLEKRVQLLLTRNRINSFFWFSKFPFSLYNLVFVGVQSQNVLAYDQVGCYSVRNDAYELFLIWTESTP